MSTLFPRTELSQAVKTAVTALALTASFGALALPVSPEWDDRTGFEVKNVPAVSDVWTGELTLVPIEQSSTFAKNTVFQIPDGKKYKARSYVIEAKNKSIDFAFADNTLRFDIDASDQKLNSFMTLKHQNDPGTGSFTGKDLEIRFTGDTNDMFWLSTAKSRLSIDTTNAWLEMTGGETSQALLRGAGEFVADVDEDLVILFNQGEESSATAILYGLAGARHTIDAKNLTIAATGSSASTSSYIPGLTAVRFEGQDLRIGSAHLNSGDTPPSYDMGFLIVEGTDNGFYLGSSSWDQPMNVHVAAQDIRLNGNTTEDSVGIYLQGKQNAFFNSERLGISGYQTAIMNDGDAALEIRTNTFQAVGNIIGGYDSEIHLDADLAYLKGLVVAEAFGTVTIDFGQADFVGMTHIAKEDEDDTYTSINLTMGEGSIWTVQYPTTDDVGPLVYANRPIASTLTTLDANAAIVDMSEAYIGDFAALSIDVLKAQSEEKGTTFILGTDAEALALTTIRTGKASEEGTHYIQLDENGDLFAEKITPDDKVLAVTDESGKLTFEGKESLTGQGLWEDLIELEVLPAGENGELGNQWFVTAITRGLGPTAEAMTAGLHNNYLFWRSGLDTTRERFGEIRSNRDTGAWVRVTAGSLSNDRLENDYQAYRFGFDMPLTQNVVAGISVERFEGSIDTHTGEGDMDATAGTFYALGVWDNGTYVDTGLRYGSMDYEYKNTEILPDAYDYDSKAFSAWLEAGREWTWRDNYTMTPHVSVTYGHFGSEDFVTANGLRAHADDVDSLVFRVGADLGYSSDKFDIALTLDALTEIEGKETILLSNDRDTYRDDADYSETWAEFGLGMAFRPTTATLFWVNAKASAWADLDHDWRINAGARYTF